MVKLFLTLVSLGFFGIVQAQTFKFSAGYSFPFLSQQIGINTTSEKTTIADPKTNAVIPRMVSTSETVRGSYGSGWSIGGAFDYKLSEHIAVEFGLNYTVGKKYITTSHYTDTQLHELKSASNESEVSQSKILIFSPVLKFITSQRIITPYFLFGPAFGKVNFYNQLDRVVEENGSRSTENSYTKFKGEISLGLRAGVGVTYMLNSSLSFFSELVFLGMNYYAKESEITRYNINGEDRLNSLTSNVRKTVYLKKVTTDTQNTTDGATEPNHATRFPIALSSITTSAGVLVKIH
jgi:hypothetical protein